MRHATEWAILPFFLLGHLTAKMEAPASPPLLVLLDGMGDPDQRSPARIRLEDLPGAHAVVDALSTSAGVAPRHLRFLTREGEWLDSEAFVLHSQAHGIPRVLRAAVETPPLESGEAGAATALALPWRAYGGYTFTGDGSAPGAFTIAGVPLVLSTRSPGVSQDAGASLSDLGPDGATGLTLWDGAVLLAKFLEAHPEKISGCHVGELGAGTGLVGISAALLGAAASVTLTDLDYSLPLMEDNMRRNMELMERHAPDRSPGIIKVEALDWNAPSQFADWDVILAADTVWLSELVPPFVDTLARLCPPGKGKKVFMSYQRRGKTADTMLWDGLAAHGFQVQEIDFRLVSTNGDGKPPGNISLFQMAR